MDWVADHRKHHAHTDQEGDPHSPHVGHGEGLRGLWHAHTGWLFETHGQADWKKYARDLYEDPGMRRIGRLFPWLALTSLVDPHRARLRPARLHARGRGARPHLGRPRARVLPAPRDVVDQLDLPLLRPPPLRGRGPLDQRRVARAAVARRGLAPQPPRLPARRPCTACAAARSTSPARSSGLMERLGLAWNVVRITPERQAAKMVGAGGAGVALTADAAAPTPSAPRPQPRPRDPVA